LAGVHNGWRVFFVRVQRLCNGFLFALVFFEFLNRKMRQLSGRKVGEYE
jgi:hypothetical protein